MRHALLILCLLFAVPASAAIITPPISVFDKPIDVKHVTATTDQNTNEEVDCYYYPEFMVKQVDAHEKGAAQLSFVPIRSGDAAPLCQRSNVSSEQVISAEDWSGYFTGVKGSYAFFDADDSVSNAMGFAVYDAKNARRLFVDAMRGNLQALNVDGSRLTMKYMRAYAAACSVVAGGEACWDQIVGETKLPDDTAQPNCEASYISADKYLAKARCRAEKAASALACYKREMAAITAQKTSEAPSMISYSVTATVTDKGGEISAEPATKAFCWPAS